MGGLYFPCFLVFTRSTDRPSFVKEALECNNFLKTGESVLFAVRCYHGGPPLGHPHGAALRDDGGRRDAQSERPGAAGRRVDLSVGYGEGHGAGAGVVRKRFRSGFSSTFLTCSSPRRFVCTHGKLKQPFFQVLLCSVEAKLKWVCGGDVLNFVGYWEVHAAGATW